MVFFVDYSYMVISLLLLCNTMVTAESLFDAVNAEMDKKDSKEKRGRKMSTSKSSQFLDR